MNLEILLTFTIGMVILSATPGPGVFASVSKAVGENFKASLFFISGLVLGDIIFLILALIGMSAIATLLGEFFFVIKLIGGCYLIYLGIKMFNSKNNFISETKKTTKGSKNFLAGLLVTLGNPKAILFYASVVPTIIKSEKILLAEAFTMMAIVAVVSFVIVGLYCYLASISKKILFKGNSNNKIGKLSGVILGITGGYIIAK